MKKTFGGIVLDTAFRIIVPFTLIYGVYVLISARPDPAAASRREHCCRSAWFYPG